MKILRFPSNGFDFVILGAAILLVVIGLSTIQSTIIAAEGQNAVLNSDLINTQITAVLGGILVFLAVTFFNYRYLELISPLVYLFIVGSLAGVLLIGNDIRGVVRWYTIGPVLFQPATLSAVLSGICFSAFFAYFKDKINKIPYLIFSLLLVLIPFGLIMMEPDLGSSIVIIGIFGGLFHLSTVKAKYIAAIYLIVLIAIPIGWEYLPSYQKDRVAAFLEPSKDPLGSGYNALQSMIAVGSGQIFGRGWGRGTQSHLQFLPEQHTDFIFASFAEEQGFVGSLVVLFLYGLIIWRCFKIIQRTSDYFGQLLVASVLLWLSIHAIINISMNIGIAPVTGITLPFISYGGTAIMTAFLALGLVESVATHQNN